MNSPVNSISNARLRETLRESGTPGVAQNNPKLMPDVANRTSLDATARSQAATSWHPAAVAVPCTRATTGCGSEAIVSMTRLHASKSPPMKSSVRQPIISLRSWPPENAGPLPATTTARIARSLAMASSAVCISSSIAREIALYCFGRFIVRRAMPASTETSTTGSASASGRAGSFMADSLDRVGGSRAVAQDELLDLAGRGLRQLAELVALRHLVARQVLATMRVELVRGDRRARLELDERARRLAPLRVGLRDDR